MTKRQNSQSEQGKSRQQATSRPPADADSDVANLGQGGGGILPTKQDATPLAGQQAPKNADDDAADEQDS